MWLSWKPIIAVTLFLVLGGCGRSESQGKEPNLALGKPIDRPEVMTARKLVDFGCVFPPKKPHSQRERNVLRVAKKGREGFQRIDNEKIYTDGIVLIEIVNNTDKPQQFHWGGINCFYTLVSFSGKKRDDTLIIGPSTIGRPLALLPGNVLHTKIDVRLDTISLKPDKVKSEPDNCYDATFFLNGSPLEKTVELCFADKNPEQISGQQRMKICKYLNPPERNYSDECVRNYEKDNLKKMESSPSEPSHCFEVEKYIKQEQKYSNCEKQCTSGESTVCMSMANYWRGYDKKKARVFYNLGCQSEDEYSSACCRFLGEMYLTGDGIRQDINKARDLLQRGCDLGHGAACENLGVDYYIRDNNLIKGRQLFKKACKLKSLFSCPGAPLLKMGGDKQRVRTMKILQGVIESPSQAPGIGSSPEK